jgi:hypothetical protein
LDGEHGVVFDPDGLLQFDDLTGFVDLAKKPENLTVVKVADAYPPQGGVGMPADGVFGPPPAPGKWDGAQTTIQRWDSDPLLDNLGEERTLRTIFTHDHLGPSSHQQAGLYAGLVVEPENSTWYLPDGTPMNTRPDGGPTNWEGFVRPQKAGSSYREFLIEFQDTQLAYQNTSKAMRSSDLFDPAKSGSNASAVFDVGQYSDLAKSQILLGFVGKGNLGKTPPEIPPAFTNEIFPGMGIPLSPKATATTVEADKKWRISEPADAPVNAGASYDVHLGGSSLFVYTPGIEPGWADPKNALNAPGAGNNGNIGPPFPQLVSAGSSIGTYSMNYRNEPILTRVQPPKDGAAGKTNAADLAYAFNSIPRNVDALNTQPVPRTPIDPAQPNGFKFPAYLIEPTGPATSVGVEQTDPFTPLLRAYAHDNVQVRVLVGAHMQAHSFQIQGLRWSYEPDYLESGFKNAQSMGISEHFEMLFRLPPYTAQHQGGLAFADYLISPSSSVDGLANGTWGILRAYSDQTDADRSSKKHLAPLINNPLRELPGKQAMLKGHVDTVKARFASNNLPGNYKRFTIHATTVFKVLAGLPADQRVLKFNPRFSATQNPGNTNYDLSTALVFVRDDDLDNGKTLRQGLSLEPLILRVAAGDWVEITLVNDLDDDKNDPALTMSNQIAGGVTPFGNPLPNVSLTTTKRAGLHPALVDFNVTEANGINVGFNPEATVEPGLNRKFYWYAGDVSLVPVFDEDGKVTNLRVAETPIEYGATNLVPSEMMILPQFGMIGSLVVEPEGSTWVEDHGTRASATVTPDDGRAFRDFVMVAQNMVGNSILPVFGVWGAINYRTEPFAARLVDPTSADSQANAVSVLAFLGSANGQPLPTLKSRNVQDINTWGTLPFPGGTLLAQATVKADVSPGTVLSFFCSQHGPMMNGSLAVGAAGGPPQTISIVGDITNQGPTWLFNNQKALNVPVKPGDTVLWTVGAKGNHGVVFDSKAPLGLGLGLAFSNEQLVPGQDPVTPVFRAAAGEPVRFRLVMPSTSTINALSPPVTFDIHGHGWPEEPFVQQRVRVVEGSYADAFNPAGLKIGRNVRSQFLGAQQVGPYEAFNFVIDHAGGTGRQEGDYLYEALQRTQFLGLWGLFRVEKNLLIVTEMALSNGKVSLKGLQLASGNDATASTISVTSPQGVTGTANVDKGSWQFTADYAGPLPLKLILSSSRGGGMMVEFLDPSAAPAKAVPGSTSSNSGGPHSNGHEGGER